MHPTNAGPIPTEPVGIISVENERERAAIATLTRELGLDLYQVDLSKVMSTIFDAAEDGQVVLFDEADSLFAKRTEVRSSNDRYANLEGLRTQPGEPVAEDGPSMQRPASNQGISRE